MKPKKPVYVYNPVNFEPQTLLPERLRKHADAARYILHRIHWGQVTKKANDRGFVPLKRAYLRSFIPKRAVRPLINALIDNGVIEADGYYVPGHKSYGYRFGEKYFRSRIVRLQLLDTKIIENMKREHRAEGKRVKLDVHRYLRSQLKLLSADVDRGMRVLEKEPQCELLKTPLLQIANGEHLFSVCRYGRVHTHLTYLKSNLRQCLNVDGQPLVSIDIRNSQPLFLALLILHGHLGGHPASAPYRFVEEQLTPFPSTPPLSNTMDSESYQDKETHEFAGQKTNANCPKHPVVNRSHLAPDEQRFLTQCEAGTLYESLMVDAEVPVRAWVKEMIFAVLFGRNRSRSPLKRQFAELYLMGFRRDSPPSQGSCSQPIRCRRNVQSSTQ